MNDLSITLSELIKEKVSLELDIVRKAVDSKNIKEQKLISFWKGLVRDPYGEWMKYYSDNGNKYFRYGKQPYPDLTKGEHISLIKKSIEQEKYFLLSLINKSFRNNKTWLIELHKKQAYKGKGGKLLTKKRTSQGEHSIMVKQIIIPLAKKYSDPYIDKDMQVITLPGICFDALPKDLWVNNNVVWHYYPDPIYYKQYLQIMRKKLIALVKKLSDNRNVTEILTIIGLYYQYGINMHMFEDINQSLFINQINSILLLLNLKPINHGVLDFVAMRFQPENFTKYFIDEIKKRNFKIKLN